MKKFVKASTAILISILMLTGCSSSSNNESNAVDPSDVMQNINARKAIAMAIDKTSFVETILNNGSIATNKFVPSKLAIDSELGDYSDFSGNLGYENNDEEAKKYWQKAKDELGFENVTLKLVLTDTEFSKRLGEYIQSELGDLDGLTIDLKQMPMKQRMEALANGDYNISFSGWGPDYPDPLTYLETFSLNNTYYEDTGYDSKEYNSLLDKAKKASTTKEAWTEYKNAEEVLLNDAYLVPIYQRGFAYLQKDYVKDIVVNPYGPKYLYKYADVDKPNKTLNMSNSDDITTLDTSLVKDALSSEVISNTMEGLTRLDKEFNASEGMAKSWEVSEDALTWTFNLRDDAVWSNGEKVTAHDFEYAWKRTLDPATACETASIFYDIVGAKDYNLSKNSDRDSVGVKAIDDYTLEVKLNRPVPYFDKMVASTSFYPQNQKFVESKGDKYGTSIENSIFNGPFILKTWKLNDQYAMGKNQTYWDSNSVKLDSINVKISKDSNTDINLYNAGEIDRTTVSSDQVDKYKDSPEFGTGIDCATNFLLLNAGNINK